MLAVDRELKPTNDKHTRTGVRETETEIHTHTHTHTHTHLSAANLETFSLDLATFQTLLVTLFLKSD